MNIFSVSSLVTLAGLEGEEKPSFATALKDQIKVLRKQLDKTSSCGSSYVETAAGSTAQRPPPPPHNADNIRALLDTLSESVINSPRGKIFTTSINNPYTFLALSEGTIHPDNMNSQAHESSGLDTRTLDRELPPTLPGAWNHTFRTQDRQYSTFGNGSVGEFH